MNIKEKWLIHKLKVGLHLHNFLLRTVTANCVQHHQRCWSALRVNDLCAGTARSVHTTGYTVFSRISSQFHAMLSRCNMEFHAVLSGVIRLVSLCGTDVAWCHTGRVLCDIRRG